MRIRQGGSRAGCAAGRITQPSLFAGGALDASTTWLMNAIKAYPVTLPGLVGSHILDGCGHWIQQERPERINELLIDWLAGLS
ncbi:alpha/beta fold hydrolase [Spongiactinospora rosea]|uniref:alpha/beta fold hydrolase n=1 Tax=Spongiactinospora rosea TaxID=2248750 RepID=UPI0018F61423|nr:alpha/beta hydrolase [Spongiactinospora rosea]